jgi:hypothetical protein
MASKTPLWDAPRWLRVTRVIEEARSISIKKSISGCAAAWPRCLPGTSRPERIVLTIHLHTLEGYEKATYASTTPSPTADLEKMLSGGPNNKVDVFVSS